MASSKVNTIDYTKVLSSNQSNGLRIFSKLLVFSTLFLILAGSLVTSTDSGLSVPDWPSTYGQFMFSFPLKDMVGGIFYEHGHRMIASIVGFFTVILAVWLLFKEQRKWVKVLGVCALFMVIFQGILGGLTVLYFLPTPISVSHAVLAQSFFCMTIIIAYSLSDERSRREQVTQNANVSAKPAVFVLAFVFIQLILGALMRHTQSGLAIPDFPRMGGELIPGFNAEMLAWINSWRFDADLDPVNLSQVVIHFVHRVWGVVVLLSFGVLAHYYRKKNKNPIIRRNIIFASLLVTTQFVLGIYTVLTGRHMWVASFHVFAGALLLGLCVLLCLRLLPTNLKSGIR